MTVNVTPTPTTGNFTDFLYGLIKPEEAFIPRVYSDDKGIPTLGVGYALVIYDSTVTHSWVLRPNLAQELSAINVTLSSADMDVLKEVALVLNVNPPASGQHVSPVAVAAIDLLIPPPKNGEIAGNLALSASLNPFQDTNLISVGDGKTLFGNIIPKYVGFVRAKLGVAPGSAFDTSQEMAALVSMAYTGYTTITKDLVAALNLPDASAARAEAWYQIRYCSNKDGIHATRRYDEAAMFGLYKDNNHVIVSDAKAVYRMFTAHRDNILAYDSANAGALAIANSQLAQVTTMTGVSLGALTTAQALGPACTQILADLANNTNPDIAAAYLKWANSGTNLSTFNPTDLYLDPGRVLSSQTSSLDFHSVISAWLDPVTGAQNTKDSIVIGESNAGSGDYLIGSNGNDLLVGGSGNDILDGGKGNDILAGGGGNDTYIVNVGETVTIEDKQGVNTILIDGKTIAYFYTTDGVTYATNDGNYTAVMNNGDFIISYTDPASQQVTTITLNNNFQSGDFGITLVDNVPLTAPTSGTADYTFNGDFKPLEQTAELANGTTIDSTWRIVSQTVGQTTTDGNGNTVALTNIYKYNQVDAQGNLIPDTSQATVRDDSVKGTSGNDLLNVGGGWNTVDATQGGNDTITGGDDNNQITVGNGDNQIKTGSGNDTLTAGNGTNLVEGGGGQDIILAGNGSNQIYAGNKVDLATALNQQKTAAASGQKGSLIAVHDGNNTIIGGNGNDAINTGTGNNTIVCGAGKNFVMSGIEVTYAGQQWFWGAQLGSTVNLITIGNINVKSAPFNQPSGYNGMRLLGDTSGTWDPLGTGNNTIFGGTGDSTYILSNGNNWLDAGGGNDQICTGIGKNTIFGGTGNDYIEGSGGTNYINLESGNDTVIAYGGNNTIIGGSGNNSIISGDVNNWATSETSTNNYIYGGSGQTSIWGSGGNDTLISGSQAPSTGSGQAKSTIIRAGDGNQYIVGGNGKDTLVGGAGSDTIYAGDGNTYIQLSTDKKETSWVYGGNGSDTIIGGAGNDVISAGDGGTTAAPTQIWAGTGSSMIYGGAGVDQLIGSSVTGGSDTLIAGSGTCTLQGGNAGTETLYASTGNATLIAGTGSDTLYGGSGNDVLRGSRGTTLFVAGSGNETIVGGSGSNTYEFDAGFGNVALTAKGSSTFKLGAGISAADLTVSQTGKTSLLIQTASGGQLTLVDGMAGAIGQFAFADNSTLGLSALLAQNGIQLIQDTGANSTLAGSTGNTTYLINNTNVTVNAADSGNTVIASVNYDLNNAANVQNLTATGSSNLTLQGNSLDNVITANSGNDTLIAGSGNDTLIAGSGTDLLQGGSGNTLFVAGSGFETIVGGTGSNTYEFDAGFGNVELQNTRTSDTVTFGAGISVSDLTVSIGPGSDGNPALLINYSGGGQITVDNGLSGAINNFTFTDPLTNATTTLTLDQLIAQANPAPTGVAGNGGNFILANGHETLVGGSGNDTIYAWNGGNTVTAGSGNQTLISESGHDVLQGGSGNDTLISAAGYDTLLGGTGNTTFVVNSTTDQIQAQVTATNTVQTSVSYDLNNATGVQNLTATGSDNLTLTANNLNDVITANSGNDTLIGGAGLDTFVMPDNMGMEVISSATGGVIDLGNNFSANGLIATQQGNDLLLQRGTNSSILLTNYYSHPQATWTIQGGGSTTTPQAILDAAAQSTLPSSVFAMEVEFSNQSKLSEMSNLRASGYVRQNDGSYLYAPTLNSVPVMGFLATQYINVNINGTLSQEIQQVWSVPSSITVNESSVAFSQLPGITTDASVVYTAGATSSSSSTTRTAQVSWQSAQVYSNQYLTPTGDYANGYYTGQGLLTPITPAPGGYSINPSTLVIDGNLGGGPNSQNLPALPSGMAYPTSVSVTYVNNQQTYGIQQITLTGNGQTVWAGQNDIVNSTNGNDLINNAGFAYGGTGNDTLIGANDSMMGSGYLVAGTGNDLLMYGDTMIGGSGNDTLIGGNTMIAGSGFNQIFVGRWDCTIEIDPSTVSTDIIGGGTSFMPPYVPGNFSANDYQDLAPYYAQGTLPQHTVAFGAGVTASDITLSWGQVIGSLSGLSTDPQSAYTTLDISWGTNNQSIQVMIPRSDDPLGSGVSQFTFTNADGSTSTLSMAQMIAMAPPAPTFDPAVPVIDLSNKIYGTTGNETLTAVNNLDNKIYAGTGNDTLIGGNLNDTLYGGVGNDTLVAGAGAEVLVAGTGGGTMIGGSGSDTFTFNLGAGQQQTVWDTNATIALSNGQTAFATSKNFIDAVQFGDGITAGDTRIQLRGADLLVNYGTQGDSFLIKDFATALVETGNNSIGQFHFTDGSKGSLWQSWPAGTMMEVNYDASGNVINATTFTTYTVNGVAVNVTMQTVDATGAVIGSSSWNPSTGACSSRIVNPDGSYNTYTDNGYGNTDTKNFASNGVILREVAVNLTYTDPVLGNQYKTTTTLYDANGNPVSDSWTQTDGSHGSDTFNADGSSSGIAYWSDGYWTYTQDAQGNYAELDYTANGVMTYDYFSHPDGSWNEDYFNADGTSSGTSYNADGSYSSYTNDGLGDVTATYFDVNGIETGYITSSNDGLGNTTTSNFDPNGIKLSDAWTKADGSSGSDTYAADGSYTSYSITAAGTATDSTYDTTGRLTSDNWVKADGSSGNDTYALDGSHTSYSIDAAGTAISSSYDTAGHELNDYWVKANGSSGSDTYALDGSHTSYSITAAGTATDSIYDTTGRLTSDNWVKADGSSGSDTFATDGSHTSYSIDAAGTAISSSFDTSGHELNDYWVKADGSSGSDTFANDGSHTSYSIDAAGTAISSSYDTTGHELNDYWVKADGSSGSDTYALDGSHTSYSINAAGTSTSSSYDTTGHELNDYWHKADGSSGSDTYALDGSHTSYSLDAAGTATDGNYDTAGHITSDYWVKASGTQGGDTYTYNADGSSLQQWTKNDGTSGSISFDSTGTATGDSIVNADGSQNLDAGGNHLLLGSTAGDTLAVASGNDILIGGAGNDVLTTGSGANLIAFNAGDGQDIVNATAGQSNTLSLGGHFAFSDLALQKNGSDLVLDVGASDSITFKNWYAGSQNIVNLQVVESAMTDFNPGSTDTLRNSNVENFDFQALVAAFDQAQITTPGLNAWGVTNDLLNAHLASSDSAALGGDLAYVYGSQGSLSGMNVVAAENTLSSNQFAAAAQTLNPWPTLNTGTAQIR